MRLYYDCLAVNTRKVKTYQAWTTNQAPNFRVEVKAENKQKALEVLRLTDKNIKIKDVYIVGN